MLDSLDDEVPPLVLDSLLEDDDDVSTADVVDVLLVELELSSATTRASW